jgi:beta-lactamase class A
MMMIALLLAAVLDKGVAGYAALNLDTGRRIEVRGDERFPMGSVFKLPAAIALLRRVDRGAFHLDQSVTITPDEFVGGWSPIRDSAHGKPVTMTLGELLRFMLGESDNTAADKVLSMIGGPEAVTKTIRDLGIQDIRVDRSERILGRDSADMIAYANDPRDTSTPNAMINLLRKIYLREDGLSPESHALMFNIMASTPRGKTKIPAAVPPGSVVVHKTGLMPGVSNDVAIVTIPDGKHHYAIAVFVKASPLSDEQKDAEVREIAHGLYEQLSR